MSVLHLKLLRELVRLWAQALAIAMVIAAGVATLIIGVGTYQSLDRTRAVYYERNDFADIFANATRAPQSLLAEIRAIDGVLTVDGRITELAPASVEGIDEPVSVLLISLPAGPQPLNRLYMRSGRLPELGHEAVVSESFADARGLELGSQFSVIMNGDLRQISIVGIALSPDYIYAMMPGEVMPSEGRFGVLWLPEASLASMYDLQAAFNTLSIKLMPGASSASVRSEVDRILAPFGGIGSYDRSQQVSHAYLDAELTQLRGMSIVLPPVFLLVAAFLVNMTLARLIALEREQIGLLKALGYSSWAIAIHYVQFVMLIALVGTSIGFAFGTWAGNGMTELYARYYSFPVLIFSRDPMLYGIATCVTVGSAVTGAMQAVRRAAWLPPAVAMLPPAPPTYRQLLGNRGHWRSSLPQLWTIVARHLLHWPWRTFGGIAGMAAACAILVGSLWSIGAMNFMVDYTFNRTERQDATIRFLTVKDSAALHEVGRLPGVMIAEPFRTVGVEIRNGHVSRRIAFSGYAPSSSLPIRQALFDPIPNTGGNRPRYHPNDVVAFLAELEANAVRVVDLSEDHVSVAKVGTNSRASALSVVRMIRSRQIKWIGYRDAIGLDRLIVSRHEVRSLLRELLPGQLRVADLSARMNITLTAAQGVIAAGVVKTVPNPVSTSGRPARLVDSDVMDKLECELISVGALAGDGASAYDRYMRRKALEAKGIMPIPEWLEYGAIVFRRSEIV